MFVYRFSKVIAAEDVDIMRERLGDEGGKTYLVTSMDVITRRVALSLDASQ